MCFPRHLKRTFRELEVVVPVDEMHLAESIELDEPRNGPVLF